MAFLCLHAAWDMSVSHDLYWLCWSLIIVPSSWTETWALALMFTCTVSPTGSSGTNHPRKPRKRPGETIVRQVYLRLWGSPFSPIFARLYVHVHCRLNLQSWLPTEFHKEINHLLVGFGQVCPSICQTVVQMSLKLCRSFVSLWVPDVTSALSVHRRSARVLRQS